MVFSQTTLILFCFVLLMYVAFIITISFITQYVNNPSPFDQSISRDAQLYNHISTGTNYVYQADTDKYVYTTLLNGQNFSKNQFLLLFDSTPYASKGHFAMTLPCNQENPAQPLFQPLIGEAPNLFSMPVGYIQNISSVPSMCVFHGQFGFGDPVTDIALKYIGAENMELKGPYSVVISTHESYIPKEKSFEELQHAQLMKH